MSTETTTKEQMNEAYNEAIHALKALDALCQKRQSNQSRVPQVPDEERLKQIARRFEDSLNKAWNGHPEPAIKATFYLGVGQAVGVLAQYPELLEKVGDMSCDLTAKYIEEHKRVQASRPWWKRILNLLKP